MIFSKCPHCSKRRLRVVKRKFRLPHVNVPVTTEKGMCGKCLKALLKVK